MLLDITGIVLRVGEFFLGVVAVISHIAFSQVHSIIPSIMYSIILIFFPMMINLTQGQVLDSGKTSLSLST